MTHEDARSGRASRQHDELLRALESIALRNDGPLERHRRLVTYVDRLLQGDADDPFFEDLVSDLVADKVPFLLFSYELASLRGSALHSAIDSGNIAEIRATQNTFDLLEDRCAALYVDHHLPALARRNHLRLGHIEALSDKNLLVHFEAHLRWMQSLVSAVTRNCAEALPERDPAQCDFGRWLNREGNLLIRDRSHRLALGALHRELHSLLDDLASSMGAKRRNRHVYALLKHAELISLDLGNEIAMINNMVIMSSYNKDPLTGLLSRRSLDKVMLNQLEITRATESNFCVVMCDLDHFKALNDAHGHLVGDEALRRFANLARMRLRQSDLIFRYGGEEFLILLPASTRDQALALAERVRHDLSVESWSIEGKTITLSASFGVVEVNPSAYSFIDAEVVREILREADSRLYRAKEAGRNRVV